MKKLARPQLHDKAAFEQALENYAVSGHARSVLASTPFVVLSGLAGGGRNTAIRLLAERYNYVFVISDTTRPPKFRDGRMEQDGVDYYFRDEADMLHDIQQGEFVEAEIIHAQQVSGTSIREIQRVAATGKIPIHDFEFGGANAVADAKPDAVVIGLLPPSYEEWVRRLNGREAMEHQEFVNRLVTAQKVLENMLSKPYFTYVINEDIDECIESIRRIVEQGAEEKEAAQAQKVARDILERVKQERARQV